jgi:hypothetical protein
MNMKIASDFGRKENNKRLITVTGNGHTYLARLDGKTASCTYSPKVAVERLVQKVWPGQAILISQRGQERLQGGSKSITEFEIDCGNAQQGNAPE